MLSKTQLFHLNKLRPTSVMESNILLALFEFAVRHYAIKVGLTNLTDLSEVYCNRKDINYQETNVFYGSRDSESEAEFRYIHRAIEQTMETIVDAYYIGSKSKRYTQLNIECSILNQNNVAISFDFY